VNYASLASIRTTRRLALQTSILVASPSSWINLIDELGINGDQRACA